MSLNWYLLCFVSNTQTLQITYWKIKAKKFYSLDPWSRVRVEQGSVDVEAPEEQDTDVIVQEISDGPRSDKKINWCDQNRVEKFIESRDQPKTFFKVPQDSYNHPAFILRLPTWPNQVAIDSQVMFNPENAHRYNDADHRDAEARLSEGQQVGLQYEAGIKLYLKIF